MKSEVKLRPDAPIFIPDNKNVIRTLFPQINKEPQCSRYSRKYVRRVDDSPISPRPILGTNNSTPRPILGRKENAQIEDNKENDENFIGKEFRSIYRRIQRLKIADDRRIKRKN